MNVFLNDFLKSFFVGFLEINDHTVTHLQLRDDNLLTFSVSLHEFISTDFSFTENLLLLGLNADVFLLTNFIFNFTARFSSFFSVPKGDNHDILLRGIKCDQ